MISIVSSSRYKINRKLLKKTSEEVLSIYNIPTSALLNIVFIGRKKMKTISAKYKQENVALPVLSFSYIDKSQIPEVDEVHKKTSGVDKEKENVIGEIFICYPQAVLLAAEKEKKVDDIILFLLKHGIDNILK